MHTLAAAVILFVAGPEDASKLTLVSERGMEAIGYYTDSRVKVSAEKPASVKKAPAGVAQPRYAVIEIAGRKGATYHLALAGDGSQFAVDSNGDGDFTNDAPAQWGGKEQKTRDGTPYMHYSGYGTFDLGTKTKAYKVRLGFRIDQNNRDTLVYYRDYAVTGEITLAGKTYPIVLNDNAVSGDFRGKALAANAGPKDSSGVTLMIDVNADRKFDRETESFDVRKPFNVGGATYEVADMAQNGLKFRVVRSTKKVEALAPRTQTPPNPSGAPDHSVGKTITAFQAKSTDGKTINFPGDYKGKVVMIDFWATWCGPCMGEIPGLVQVHNKLQGKGFEVLGIAMENQQSLSKMKPVTEQKGMKWPQICDGQGWNTAIAKQYGVRSIPACYLVDGDTGEILAAKDQLRGAALQQTVERALAKKKR